MTTNAHDLSLRILAGFLSIIMTLLMFLPMKAAFGESVPVMSGEHSGRMDDTSELRDTQPHRRARIFVSPAMR